MMPPPWVNRSPSTVTVAQRVRTNTISDRVHGYSGAPAVMELIHGAAGSAAPGDAHTLPCLTLTSNDAACAARAPSPSTRRR